MSSETDVLANAIGEHMPSGVLSRVGIAIAVSQGRERAPGRCQRLSATSSIRLSGRVQTIDMSSANPSCRCVPVCPSVSNSPTDKGARDAVMPTEGWRPFQWVRARGVLSSVLVRLSLLSVPKSSQREAERARIILGASEGLTFSEHSVLRIWRAFGLQPHRVDSFKVSKDPMFVEKVRAIVGLYLNPPDKAIVLCVDEKGQTQALERSTTQHR
jgi:hypothetical protein